jgi:hypothetical protein
MQMLFGNPDLRIRKSQLVASSRLAFTYGPPARVFR